MSKSYGNYIGLWEEAPQAYGKLMSISDELMWRYFYLLLHKTHYEIAQMQAGVEQKTLHPMDLKKKMAHDIIQRFWSFKEAEQAQANFENLFQKQDYTQAQEIVLPNGLNNPLWIVTLLKELGAVSSTSEGKRLIEGKAVSIDTEIISDFKAEIKYVSGMIIKVGKHRIFKIK
jgi:tyrosyl-tRNA synthetase